MNFRTEQEKFWNGSFGDEYVERNSDLLPGKLMVWSTILSKLGRGGIDSVIEFGSNIGLNLKAIKMLMPNAECAAIEINHKAATILREDSFWGGNIDIMEESILTCEPKKQYDLVFTAGVLIHMNPEVLDEVYEKLYRSSKKYICMCEYYNPTPVMIEYRGNKERLFKRDFAGEFMDKHSDIELIDYGFFYHRDNVFPRDDVTWFLMKKK